MHWWKKAIYILVVSNILLSCDADLKEQQNDKSKINFLDELAHANYSALEQAYTKVALDSNFVKNYPIQKKLNTSLYFFPTHEWKKEIYTQLSIAHEVKDSTAHYFTGYNTNSKETVHFYIYPPDSNICVLEIHE